MVKKYGLGVNHELNAYYKSENLKNTDFSSYVNLNSNDPDAFVGFTANMFINPQSLFIEPKNLKNYDDIEKYNKIEKIK